MLEESKDSFSVNTHERLTKWYMIALLVVGFLTLIGQLFIQYYITKQMADSNVINQAGKQRYTSQEIVKLSMYIVNDVHINTYKNQRQSLSELLTIFKKRHEGLQYGNDSLGLPKNTSKEIVQLFKKNQPAFDVIYFQAQKILSDSLNDSAQKSALQHLLNHERDFLVSMNEIVMAIDRQAKEKVLTLKEIEWYLFLITIFVLILEGVYIFRPLAKHIKASFDERHLAEKNAIQLANKLKISNKNLSKYLKELKDIHFALERNTLLVRTDKEGVIIFASDFFCKRMGYNSNELIGQRFSVLNSQYHQKVFFQTMWDELLQGKIWNNEIRNKTKEGELVWLDTTIIPIKNASDEISQFVAIYTDLSMKFKHTIDEQKERTSLVLEGQEKERRNIARDLHDGLGQMLTGLKFQISSFTTVHLDEAIKQKEVIKQTINDLILEVRRISFNLMPSVLQDFGLSAGIEHLCERTAFYYPSIKVEYIGLEKLIRLDKKIEINCYRICQEAINNAIKYSGASKIEVNLDMSEGILLLEIADNGKGFVLTDKKKSDGSGRGLLNIKERSFLIEGNVKIDSMLDEGTTIKIEIPIEHKLFVNNEQN
jgi:PAS domain S-box-containing protein